MWNWTFVVDSGVVRDRISILYFSFPYRSAAICRLQKDIDGGKLTKTATPKKSEGNSSPFAPWAAVTLLCVHSDFYRLIPKLNRVF